MKLHSNGAVVSTFIFQMRQHRKLRNFHIIPFLVISSICLAVGIGFVPGAIPGSKLSEILIVEFVAEHEHELWNVLSKHVCEPIVPWIAHEYAITQEP